MTVFNQCIGIAIQRANAASLLSARLNSGDLGDIYKYSS